MDMKCPINPQDEASTSRPVNNTSATNREEPDFSEFEWMAEQDLEEFDRKVEKEIENEIWEEQFIENCFEEMWREEERREREELVYFNTTSNNMADAAGQNNQQMVPLYARGGQTNQIIYNGGDISTMMNGLSVGETNHRNNMVTSSLPTITSKPLNPDAAVFVPRGFGAVSLPKPAQNGVDR